LAITLNYQSVSLTPEANFAGFIETGGKFATGVVDIGGNLLPVSLILVVHLDFGIFSANFQKVWNDPYVIFRGLGEHDSWKKPEAKNPVTLSL
jgi:hypothetical protein